MTFSEILEKLIYGKKVRRSSWSKGLWIESNGDSIFQKCYVKNEVVNTKRFTNEDKVFCLDDVTADDWEVMK